MLSLTSSKLLTVDSFTTFVAFIIWYPKELLTGAEISPSPSAASPAKKSVS